MKTLWNYIDNKNWKEETKYRMALLILGVLSALAGAALWLIVRTWMLSTPDWLICFVGYPVVISWFVIFFYSCRHEFHDGAPRTKYKLSQNKPVTPTKTAVTPRTKPVNEG